jgi:hypothetical protein
MYLSITGVTDDKKLAKYQPFESEADANAHAEKYNGFVVEDIGGNQEFWIVDKEKKTITQDTATENSVTAKRNAMAEIRKLESQITNRRLREAYKDSTWLDAQEALIKTQRDKL